jgi:hypothetical protein
MFPLHFMWGEEKGEGMLPLHFMWGEEKGDGIRVCSAKKRLLERRFFVN